MKKIILGLAVLLAAASLFQGAVNGDEAVYRITFEARWTPDLPRPGGAHFSPLVGATHHQNGALFTSGELASPGVERVAELGSNSVIFGEINEAIGNGQMGQLLQRSGNVGPVETVDLTFVANSNFPLVSMLTMIAPSPDWFVGFHAVSLLDQDGLWRNKIELVLNSYDAGTEEGQNFSLSNPATVPQEVIQALDIAEPNGVLHGVGSLASVTITRIDAVPNSLNRVRGTLVAGELASILRSDDVSYDVQPGFTLNNLEAPIWLEFTGELNELNNDMRFEIESQANTPGVAMTLELLNHITGSYEEVLTTSESFNSDTVVIADPSGNFSPFVDSNGQVQSRVGWRAIGFTLLFPWTVQVDHVRWSPVN